MAYANFYYCDYSSPTTNNFIAELYKNFQQRMQWISSNPFTVYKPLPTPTMLFNFCNTDSCKNWAYTGFKYPTLPERKLSLPTIKFVVNIFDE